MEGVKEWAARLLAKLKEFYGEKETLRDGVFIGGILLLIFYFPSIYTIIPLLKWRIFMTILIICSCFVLILVMIRRLFKRQGMEKIEKAVFMQFLKRFLLLCLCLLFTGVLQVWILYPTFSNVETIHLTAGKTFLLWIVQSIFFSFYSQAFVSACMKLKETMKEWAVGFLKTCKKSILPLAILAFLATAATQTVYRIAPIPAQMLSVIFTVFLWLTAIIIQERECYES